MGWTTVAVLENGDTIERNNGISYYYAPMNSNIGAWQYLCPDSPSHSMGDAILAYKKLKGIVDKPAKMVTPFQRAKVIAPFITEYLSSGNHHIWKQIQSYRAAVKRAEADVYRVKSARDSAKGKKLYTRYSDPWTEPCYTEFPEDFTKILINGLESHLAMISKNAKRLAEKEAKLASPFYTGLYDHLESRGYPSTKTTREAVKQHLERL